MTISFTFEFGADPEHGIYVDLTSSDYPTTHRWYHCGGPWQSAMGLPADAQLIRTLDFILTWCPRDCAAPPVDNRELAASLDAMAEAARFETAYPETDWSNLKAKVVRNLSASLIPWPGEGDE